MTADVVLNANTIITVLVIIVLFLGAIYLFKRM